MMKYRVRQWAYKYFICWWKGHVPGWQVGRWDDNHRCIHCRELP